MREFSDAMCRVSEFDEPPCLLLHSPAQSHKDAAAVSLWLAEQLRHCGLWHQPYSSTRTASKVWRKRQCKRLSESGRRSQYIECHHSIKRIFVQQHQQQERFQRSTTSASIFGNFWTDSFAPVWNCVGSSIRAAALDFYPLCPQNESNF